MYHRVATLPGYPFPLAVTPGNFDSQMAYVKRFCHPMRLSYLAQAAGWGHVPRAAIAVTFDDGYLDNLTQALPVLRKYRIPATIFVSTGQIDSGKEFWWDELERLVLGCDSPPSSISLSLDGNGRKWTFNHATDRQTAIQEIRDRMRRLHPQEREKILGSLAEQMGYHTEPRCTFLTMTSAQLKELSRCHLIDLGAHTVNHPVLSTLSKVEQEVEILDSRSRLQEIINQPITTFAYPYGAAEDFNRDSIAIVQSHGFEAACGTIPGTVGRDSDLFNLPRCWVGDWDTRHFGWRLTEYFKA